MSARSGSTRKQTFVVLCVFAAPACAVAIEDPVANVEIAPTAGLGGALSGAAGLGGSAGVGGALGGGTGGTSGTGGGSAGRGGTSAGMGTTGGAGGSVSGTGGGAGVGGASAGTSALGGKGGKGGAGGTSGTSGASGKGGTSGTSGKGGAGGSGGTGTVGDGCAELSVPLNAANDKAHFTISLTGAADLSDPGTTISLRIYVEAGTGGRIFAYAQDSEFDFLAPATRPLLADQSGWVTLTWNIAAEPAAMSGMSKANVTRIGIEIQAAPSMTWSNPTVVYVDSITVDSTPALSFGFGMRSTVSTAMNQTTDPTGTTLWLNAGSTDTTATGTTLGWVDSCP